ncbi:site-specific integrase [Staphylococcus aureus]|uniref:site-specific integrase n=1 Tax=Staphylococcus aureus TaxID=1280 RepID=UPI001886F9E1|nr:tyrosine-type recombinase/integrase [Staphylococcus aureus]MBF2706241.1 site-specific integrase [Staphylococcus aureus]MBF2722795.1 site-specific integrase [Staphylococcus aureus]MBU6092605.1 site-specific integrase [Staphylococcus aureus]MBU6935486.1 site-specific integrase [Staphylococcus aureus]MBU7224574.1 site-specific integrase [Staphylococcus aureus]
MASYEKQKNTWRFVISYKDDSGKFRKIQKGGFKTKREAQIHANDLEYNLKRGYDVSNEVVFADYFKQWYELNKRGHVTDKTLERYEVTYKEIKNYFGYKLVKDIKRSDYQQFLNKYGENHAHDTVKKCNSYIRSCFDYAIHEGIILRNPTFKANIKAGNPNKSEDAKFISETEFKRLKRYFEEKDTTSAMVVLMAMATGGRFSEIANMKREDFNFSNNTVHLPGTKTDTSDRVVSLDLKTMQRVKQFIESRPQNINGYVFTTYGTPISNQKTNKALYHACKQCDVKTITIHAIRHTVASILIRHGYSIYFIAKRLGHKSVKTTYEIYGHLLEESYEEENTKAMKLMNDL